MLVMQAAQVEEQVPRGTRQHPTAGVVLVDRLDRAELHRAGLDGRSCRCDSHSTQVVPVTRALLVGVAADFVEHCGGQGVDVVEQIQVAPASQGRIEPVDELFGGQGALGVLEHAAPLGAQRGVDALALPVFVDQLVAIRQPGHELARIKVQHVHALRPVVDRAQHAEALQVDQGVVAVLAIARAAKVQAADGRSGQGQTIRGMRAFERLAVEVNRHGEARAQRGDARGQVGQVDAAQLDLRTLGRRFVRLDDVDRCSGQGRGGVEVRAQAA